MALTKKKGSSVKKVTERQKGISVSKGRQKTAEDKSRLLTPEEIAEARQKIREKFEKVARRYGFVMDME